MAVGNDVGYDQIFVQQLMNLWLGRRPGARDQRHRQCPTCSLPWSGPIATTYHLRPHRLQRRQAQAGCRPGLHVPLDDMGMVESIHLCVFHWVLNDVFARINREGRYRGLR